MTHEEDKAIDYKHQAALAINSVKLCRDMLDLMIKALEGEYGDQSQAHQRDGVDSNEKA